MPHDTATKPLIGNVIPFVTVVDVRLKILEALGAEAIDFERARAIDLKSNRAPATELRAIFEQLDDRLIARVNPVSNI